MEDTFSIPIEVQIERLIVIISAHACDVDNIQYRTFLIIKEGSILADNRIVLY